MARVERDADGKIIRVLKAGERSLRNPLGDLLTEMEDEEEDEDGEEWEGLTDGQGFVGAGWKEGEGETEVVRSLREDAGKRREVKKRHVGEREREWLERLVAKHGENTAAMTRDMKLNPMQQSEGDLKKRIRRLQAE